MSVIIPMKNEKQYIGNCLESVVNQNYPQELIEIIVVDGGSTDGSLKVVRDFMGKHSNIKLLGGPGVNCPAAMNIGIRNATGQLISKIDAHGYVDSDFLRMGAQHISKDKSIMCVGGPITPITKGSVAKTNALARSSIFGVGKGTNSVGARPRFVDTVQCGIYQNQIFAEVGLFDESLQFGEDEEINWRIRKKGYKIFSTPEIKFFYFPRDSFRKLFEQYYNYGVARVRVIRKHRDFANIKHVIPTTFIFALSAMGLAGIFNSLFLRVFFGIGVSYLVALLVFSTIIGAKYGWKYVGLLPISFAALHFGYGIGFAMEIIRLFRSKMIRK